MFNLEEGALHVRTPGWWRCGNRCLIWSNSESLKVDTCSVPLIKSSSWKWKWTAAHPISFITSRPLGSCSSPDQPSCPRPGNSQIGEEPLRFVFKKQARRTKTVSLASLWSILNSPMNLKTLGWSYQTVCEFWPLSIECWIMICNSKPSAYPDSFPQWSWLVDATWTWLQQRACTNIQSTWLEDKNFE